VDAREIQREKERLAASCVVAAADGYSLHDNSMREAPDVDLVHADGHHVGLEVVRTQDERPLSLRRRMYACSEAIKEAFVAAGITGSFTPYYDLIDLGANMERGAKRAWDRTVPQRLVHLVAVHGAVRFDT
jgi:hypothetical protein